MARHTRPRRDNVISVDEHLPATSRARCTALQRQVAGVARASPHRTRDRTVLSECKRQSGALTEPPLSLRAALFRSCVISRRSAATTIAMSDAVNAAFERSEQLRQQWERLKADMLAIDPSHADAAQRRDQLRVQMDQVMNQLSTVVDETRRLVPNNNATDDDEPIMEARPVQYSANHKHVVYRTYESSESSEELDSLSLPDPPPKPPQKPPRPSVRIASPPASPTTDVTLVSSPQSTRVNVQAKRGSLANFKKGIRGKLRLNDSNSTTPRATSSTEPTVPAPVAKQNRDGLLVEQTRLERESRRLNRKPFRSPEDDKRLLDIAGALSRISSTLAEMPESSSPRMDQSCDDITGAAGSRNRCRNESELEKEILVSPVTDDDNNRPLDSQSLDSCNSRPNKSSHPKRKKGWSALEAGFASFKALGRSVRNAAAAGSRTDTKHESDPSKAKEKTKSAQNTHDLFSETVNRVHERGEKLEGIADDSERMVSDTNDMLAAARALNQRHKGGFFS